MKAFDFKRFGMLARWTLTNDKAYYRKTFLNMLTTLTLLFLFFVSSLMGFKEGGRVDQAYNICAVAVKALFLLSLVMGGVYMYYSMTGKHDRQTLMMLPASNLEKFLMRYVTWILLLPLFLCASLIADGVQYVVCWLQGDEQLVWVTSRVIEDTENFIHLLSPQQALAAGFFFLWLHSLFVLGANFFRSHKYNWVFTVMTLILFGTLLVWLVPENTLRAEAKSGNDVPEMVICGLLIVFNFWLAFKLFCRQQVISKFVNI